MKKPETIKVTKESTAKAAERIWAAGDQVSWSSMRKTLRCRNGDLKPFMPDLLNDPRNKRQVNREIAKMLDDIRCKIIADQTSLWAEQIEELSNEADDLQDKLESAQAEIASLKEKLASTIAESATIKQTADSQLAPLMQIVADTFKLHADRVDVTEKLLRLAKLEAAAKVIPCDKRGARYDGESVA